VKDLKIREGIEKCYKIRYQKESSPHTFVVERDFVVGILAEVLTGIIVRFLMGSFNVNRHFLILKTRA
jgi:transposase